MSKFIITSYKATGKWYHTQIANIAFDNPEFPELGDDFKTEISRNNGLSCGLMPFTTIEAAEDNSEVTFCKRLIIK